jgi:hypothetical protein
MCRVRLEKAGTWWTVKTSFLSLKKGSLPCSKCSLHWTNSVNSIPSHAIDTFYLCTLSNPFEAYIMWSLKQRYKYVPKILQPFKYSRPQKGDMTQVPHWLPTIIRCRRTKFSRPDHLVAGTCASQHESIKHYFKYTLFTTFPCCCFLKLYCRHQYYRHLTEITRNIDPV